MPACSRFPLALAAAATALAFGVAPLRAGVGDLLVAPTRIILDGRRGTEIILNNIGDDVATYRVTVELRRMKPDGTLETVTAPNARESAAEAMILYAPRKVTLPPNQPQSIRINARAPQGLADGEYRAHLLFRAIPDARPVTAAKPVEGLSFRLTPVYGVTIPVIVRLGNLSATAGIANVAKRQEGGKPVIGLDLSRVGQRSTFGEVRVMKAGIAEPIALAGGVALYTEIDKRHVTVPIDDRFAAAATGAVTVEYIERTPTGLVTLASTSAILR
jgi:P pilus assembly chaperone PapD